MKINKNLYTTIRVTRELERKLASERDKLDLYGLSMDSFINWILDDKKGITFDKRMSLLELTPFEKQSNITIHKIKPIKSYKKGVLMYKVWFSDPMGVLEPRRQ